MAKEARRAVSKLRLAAVAAATQMGGAAPPPPTLAPCNSPPLPVLSEESSPPLPTSEAPPAVDRRRMRGGESPAPLPPLPPPLRCQ